MKSKKKTIESEVEKTVELTDDKKIENEDDKKEPSLKDSEYSESFKQLQKELLDENTDKDDESKIDDEE